jgi:hypothetical protein
MKSTNTNLTLASGHIGLLLGNLVLVIIVIINRSSGQW